MLDKQPRHVTALGFVRFAPQTSFVHRLSAIAESVSKKYKFEHWNANASRFLFVQPSELRAVHLDHSRVQFQTLDLTTWNDNLDQHIDIAKMALDGYVLDTVDEVTCQFDLYLDVGMSYREVSELGFGSLLCNSDAVSNILPDANDWHLQLVRENEDGVVRVEVAPMSRADAETTFKITPNLQSLVVSPLWDTSIGDRLDELSQDCLYLKTTVSRVGELPVREIAGQFATALEFAKKASSEVVAKLKALG